MTLKTQNRTDRHRSDKEFYDSFWLGQSGLTCDEKCRLRFIISAVKSHIKSDVKAAINLDASSGLSAGRGPRRIADVGCGRGWLTSLLSAYGKVTGFDMSTAEARNAYPGLDFVECNILELAGLAKLGPSNVSSGPKGISTSAGTATAWPAWGQRPEMEGCADFSPDAGNQFDIVVCSEVIEHVRAEEQPGLVESLASILRKQGTLILTTPNRPVVSALVHKLALQHELQPVESWLDAVSLKELISPRFDIQELTSVMFFPVFFRRVGALSRIYRFLYEQWAGYRLLDPLLGPSLGGLYLALVARKKRDSM